MSALEPLSIEFEFGRVDRVSDPYGFQFSPQDYFLRHGKGSYDNLRFPWSPEILSDLQAVRLPGRDPALVQQLGDLLRGFLQATDWSAHEAQILDAVQARRQVMLTVRSAAAELYALPWELLTLRSTGQHLGELPALLLRYEWPEISAAPEQPLPRPAGGRILLAWSAAAGAVPATEHLTAIESACAASGHSFVADRDVLANASCGRVVAALQAAADSGQPIAVLHLLCHGSASGSTFGLALDPDDGGTEAQVIDAAQLRQAIAPFAGMVRLVVLAACDSGNSGSLGNHLGSLAQELHRARIAEVVASRYPLSADGSIRLAQAFYRELVTAQASTERAFLAARSALAENSRQLDWASLQLYVSSSGSHGRPIVFRPYQELTSLVASKSDFIKAAGELPIDEKGTKLAQALSAPNRPLLVSGPSPQQLREVVIAPAQRLGLQFEPGLVERMLAEIADTPDALPFLEHALDRLWQQRDGQTLTQSAYDAQGGVAGAIHDHAERVLASLTPDEQELARQILLWLGCDWQADGGSRRRLRVAMVRPSDAAAAVSFDRLLQRLVAERLIIRAHEVDEKGHAEELVQASHGSLLRKWKRLLGWLASEHAMLDARDVLTEWVTEWRLRDTLLSSSQLGYVQLIEKRHPEALSREARDLVAQSQRVRDNEQAFSVVALDGLRFATAQSHYPRDPTRMALVMCEALSGYRAFVIPGWLKLALDIMHNQVLTVLELSHAFEVRQVAPIPDGEPLAVVLQDGSVWFWDSATLCRPFKVPGHRGGVNRVLWSPDSRRLVTLSKDCTARVSAIDGSGEPLVLSGHKDSVICGAYAHDGSQIATGSLDGTARVFDAHDGHLLGVFEGHQGGVRGIAFSPDGKRIYAASAAGKVSLLELGKPQKTTLLFEEKAPISDLALSPDGARIATASSDHLARVYDLQKPGPPMILRGHQGPLLSIAWSGTGDRLLTCSADATARVFRLDAARPPCILSGHLQDVACGVFSRDGKYILTAGSDRRIRFWDALRKGLIEPKILHGNDPMPGGFKVIDSGMRPATQGFKTPDGAFQITLAEDFCVRVVDLEKKSTQLLSGHSAAITSVAYTQRMVITGSEDRTARVFFLDGQRPPLVMFGHLAKVVFATVYGSRDDVKSMLIITVDGQGTLRFFGVEQQSWVLLDAERPDALLALAGASQIITRSPNENEFYLWEIPRGDIFISTMKNVGPIKLTPDERKQLFL